MDWDVYTVFSVISGVALAAAALGFRELPTPSRLGLAFAALVFFAWGVFVAGQDSGFFLFSPLIFIFPIGVVILVIWGVRDRDARDAWLRGDKASERAEAHLTGGQSDGDRATAGTPAGAEEPILVVDHLVKHFPIKAGILIDRQIGAVQAVDDVSFSVKRGETLGLVGESGCGKSTLARSILQLIKPTSGSVRFEGKEIAGIGRRAGRALRGDMQMVFQDPYASLNPRKRIAQIVGDPMRLHGIVDREGQKDAVRELLEKVGLNPEHYNRFPHEFSGGQRQRIGIARALSLNPKLIIADEPVSALDVSIQAQILNLLEDLQDEFDLTYMFVAHDLSVVRHVADRIAVMYLGKIVEIGPAEAVYNTPIHPYTQALLSAVPIPDPRANASRKQIILEGDVPSPANPPSACRFHTRCPYANEVCSVEDPVLIDHGKDHFAACHHPLDVQGHPQRDKGRVAAPATA